MTTQLAARLRSDDMGKLVLRLAVGGLMLPHGIFKLQNGIAWMFDALKSRGLPGPMAYGAYVGEVLAPILLLIGLWTRPAALLVAFTMLVAVYVAHTGDVARLTQQGGWALELQGLFFLGAMALFLMGGGKYGVSRGRGAWN